MQVGPYNAQNAKRDIMTQFRYATITGTGSYLPEQVVTNFDLEKMVDTSDEWIRQRTGITERRIAEADVATSDLCVHAARWAIKNAHIDPLDIEMIPVSYTHLTLPTKRIV